MINVEVSEEVLGEERRLRTPKLNHLRLDIPLHAAISSSLRALLVMK